jgi:hypothetical protein
MRFRALIFLAAIAIAAAYPAIAGADVQTIAGFVAPKKLDKKAFRAVSTGTDIVTNVDAAADPNLDQPPTMARARIDLPSNLKFKLNAYPRCKTNAKGLANTTTKMALAACGAKSKTTIDAGTSAHLVIDQNPLEPASPAYGYDVEVTGFNGHDGNKIYLHTRSDALNTTLIVVGSLKKGPKGYGSTLVLPSPPLEAGALDDFQTEFKKSAAIKGRCKAKKNRWRVRTDYTNHAPTVAEYSSPCKRKKGGGHGK